MLAVTTPSIDRALTFFSNHVKRVYVCVLTSTLILELGFIVGSFNPLV